MISSFADSGTMETRPRTPQVTKAWFADSGTMETRPRTQRKTADDAPSLALSGSRPPLGDYLCGWL